MKKLFVILTLISVIAIQILYAANSHAVDNTANCKNSVWGLKTLDLHTRNTTLAVDTFATTVCKYYGPYEFAGDGGSPATSFQLQADVITGVAATMSFGYQATSTKLLTDTMSWTEVDTLDSIAVINGTETISAVGNYLWFRVHNYNGAAGQIPGRVRVMIKPSTTLYRDKF